MTPPPRDGGDVRVNARLTVPRSELSIERARAGGPGGQNVNKVESKIVLRFSLARSAVLGPRRQALLRERLAARLTKDDEIVIHAARFREQARNEVDARERLAALLRAALVTTPTRKATEPTRASRKRRLEEKRRRAERKRERGTRFES